MICNMNAVWDMEKTRGSEPIIRTVDALPVHIRALGVNLRERDFSVIKKLDIEPHRALWRMYRSSLICKTVFIDDKIGAIGGVMGVFLGETGRPWFCGAPFVEDYPMKLAFGYKRQIKNMLKLFSVLEDWVCIDDYKTIKLLGILGFKFSEPKTFNGIVYTKATLNR